MIVQHLPSGVNWVCFYHRFLRVQEDTWGGGETLIRSTLLCACLVGKKMFQLTPFFLGRKHPWDLALRLFWVIFFKPERPHTGFLTLNG